MYKTRNKPHRGIFSLSLSLSFFPLDETRSHAIRLPEYVYPVSRAYRASASLRFPTSSRANSTSRDWLWQFIGRYSIRKTRRSKIRASSRGSPPEKRGVHLARELKRTIFSHFPSTYVETRSFRISKIVIDTKNRALKHLAFILFPLLDGRPYTWQSIDSFPFRDTYFPSRARFSAFHRGENSVRTNERLAAVKRQTRRFKGWMHLTLKEPHSAPLSCVIFQPI